MVRVCTTLIINGRLKLEDCPEILQPAVKQMLIDLEVAEYV